MKTQGSPPLVRERRFSVEDGEYTQFRAYDISNKKESIFSSTSGNSSSKEQGSNQPLLNIDSSNISIRVLLQHVNDWQGRPYVNSDGTPNYGIYFRDNKTGGVMYIGDHPRSCGKDAGDSVFHAVAPGSPPLVRERHEHGSASHGKSRITPARAGKTGHQRRLPLPHRDHPRSCGKDTNKTKNPVEHLGSPPLVRERLQIPADWFLR